MAIRALLLGTTGVNKSFAVKQLHEYRKMTAQPAPFKAVDFEREYITTSIDTEFASFLDFNESVQYERWDAAWHQFHEEFPPERDVNLILSLHGVVLRELYGVRSLIAVDAIRQYQPTHMITLMDDVYMQWRRTELRAGGREYVGQPTLLQLLDGRHSELVIADVFRRCLPSTSRPKNWLVAARHPARVLDRLLFGSGDVLPVYLSFPISEPRRMEKAGDHSGIEEINKFLVLAMEQERSSPHVVCFSPLAIDELPLAARVTGPGMASGEETVDFSPAKERWEVRDYIGEEDLLLTEETDSAVIQVPAKQLREAEGMIRGDVGVRDYRLVRQARRLVVFNPWFNGRPSSGVINEVDHAVDQRLPVHIFQDPAHDVRGEASAMLKGTSGALGGRPGRQRVQFHSTIREALGSACKP